MIEGSLEWCEARIAELETTGRALIKRWHCHSGACITYMPDGKSIVTPESCKCESEEKALRKVLGMFDASPSVSDECECPPEGHMLGCKRDRLEPLKQRASALKQRASANEARAEIAEHWASIYEQAPQRPSEAQAPQWKCTCGLINDERHSRCPVCGKSYTKGALHLRTNEANHAKCTYALLVADKIRHKLEGGWAPTTEDLEQWWNLLLGNPETSTDVPRPDNPRMPELLRDAGRLSGLKVTSREDRAGEYWQVTGPFRSTPEEAKEDLRSLLRPFQEDR